MASLANKVAVVTGGSGTVGSGIIYQLLKAGAKVIAPVRNERGKQSLLSELESLPSTANLETPLADVSDAKSVEALGNEVKTKYGTVDHVVTAVGSWWQKGPLLQFAGLHDSCDEMLTQYQTYVMSHFIMAKVFVPLLKAAPESSFTFITGSGGEQLFNVDASMIRAQVGALFCVIDCIQVEYADKSYPRINEFRIRSWIKRHAEATGSGGYSHRVLGQYLLESCVASNTKGQLLRVADAELAFVNP
ncbi:hypothetical protein KFL_002770030 [Klebsormidium nitens]|uniref:NAD(P)-binding Rossmann-fold superfamily protein n=1 Tax=Klebsormidium nitens TaxID=105231 RepID=A0A1Y1IBZ2_KLENI|nr:hypothetical protein KFL_002770030 [Klebsormidium nitens]|eukprot:GAQ86226.1 hypothetical protein KFL_002770030 [Klebsormidium nitens]